MVAYTRAALLRFDSASVVSDLVSLRQWRGAYHTAAAELGDACGAGNIPRAEAPLRELRRLFDGQAEVLLRLKRNVQPFNRVASATIGSVAELVLCARLLVIEAQLHRLSDLLCSEFARTQVVPLFRGRLCQVSDTIERQQQRWLALRKRHIAFKPSTRSEARAYLEAVRDTSRAVTALGDDPNVSDFLRVGAALVERPDVQNACALIAAAIGVGSEVREFTMRAAKEAAAMSGPKELRESQSPAPRPGETVHDQRTPFLCSCSSCCGAPSLLN